MDSSPWRAAAVFILCAADGFLLLTADYQPGFWIISTFSASSLPLELCGLWPSHIASLASVFRCFLSSLSQPLPVLGRMQSADFWSLFPVFWRRGEIIRGIKSLWCNIIQSFLVFFLLPFFSRTFLRAEGMFYECEWANRDIQSELKLRSFMGSHPSVIWCQYYFMCETLTLRVKRRLCGSSHSSLLLRRWKVLKRCLLLKIHGDASSHRRSGVMVGWSLPISGHHIRFVTSAGFSLKFLTSESCFH